MADGFLTEEWLSSVLEEGGKLPPFKGADLTIEFEINKIPKTHELGGKKVRCFAELLDGQLRRLENNSPADSKTLKPQVSVRLEYKYALKVLMGELNPQVGYMQGKLKLDGSYETVLFKLRDFFATTPWINFWSQVGSSL